MFVFWQISHQNLIRWGIFFYAQKIAKSTILGYPRTKNGLMVGESYIAFAHLPKGYTIPTVRLTISDFLADSQ